MIDKKLMRSIASVDFLVAEFDREKNVGLRPEDISAKNLRTQVWWRCSRGHSWMASPSLRANWKRSPVVARPCPCCSGRKVAEDNHLGITHPRVAEQWDEDKNGNLRPSMVVAKTVKKVWWRCLKGHSWRATVHSRTYSGHGCPKCHGNGTSHIEMRIFSEVKWLFPDAENRAKVCGVEVDVWVPSERLAIEVDGYHWHKDKPKQDNRKDAVLLKGGVRIIRLREVPLKVGGDHYVRYERLEKHLDICKRLVGVLSKVIGRRLSYGCLENEGLFLKMLSDSSPDGDGNKLFMVRPDIRGQWSDKNGKLGFDDVTKGSNRKVWWKCDNGHEWESTPNSRSNGRNCPYCSGRRPSEGHNLKDLFPEVARQLHSRNGVDAKNVSFGSARKMWWRCDKGHEWIASVNARTNVGTGCPHCYAAGE